MCVCVCVCVWGGGGGGGGHINEYVKQCLLSIPMGDFPNVHRDLFVSPGIKCGYLWSTNSIPCTVFVREVGRWGTAEEGNLEAQPTLLRKLTLGSLKQNETVKHRIRIKLYMGNHKHMLLLNRTYQNSRQYLAYFY